MSKKDKQKPLSQQEMEGKLFASNLHMTHAYEHFYKVPGPTLFHKPFTCLKGFSK